MKTLTPRQDHAGSCFEATLEVASETRDAVVIHGWLHNQERWILHAWCEVDEWVIDLTETREPIDKVHLLSDHGRHAREIHPLSIDRIFLPWWQSIGILGLSTRPFFSRKHLLPIPSKEILGLTIITRT
jgi:hypothetical protein